MTGPMMIQAELVSAQNEVLTTWVEKDRNLQEGYSVFLKEPKKWYTVSKIYDLEVSKDQLDSNRNWDNNNYDEHISTSMKERFQ